LLASFAIENRPHADINRKALPCMAFVDTADRGNVAIIPAIRETDVPEATGRPSVGSNAIHSAVGEKTST
jgi:hypothetical protein